MNKEDIIDGLSMLLAVGFPALLLILAKLIGG